MGGWGGQNPWPFQWGGGTTAVEDAYNAYRSARGVGGSGPQGGIDDAFLWEEATACAASDAAVERAALQAFPLTATDHIKVWEKRFGIVTGGAGTDQDRRVAIVTFDAQVIEADVPDLSNALTAISSYLGLEIPTRAQSTITVMGKVLAPRGTGVPSYGGVGSQNFVNYADEYVMQVTWDTVAAGGVLPDQSILDAVTALLSAQLPAWMDFAIHQKGGGFFFDGGSDGLSCCDFTAFGTP